jgi:hypothetical protein
MAGRNGSRPGSDAPDARRILPGHNLRRSGCLVIMHTRARDASGC